MSERTLVVELHGRQVGHLWGDGNRSLFSFHDEYLDASDRPVLGQRFEDRLSKKARRVAGIHPWFENLLPERGGALRRRYLRAFSLGDNDDLGLLANLGGDLPGAVVVRPSTAAPSLAHVVDEERPDPVALARFSLGGVQLKFSMSGEPERLALGLTDPGGRAWILKVGTPEFPRLAENEHAVMTWCRLAGFDVPETHVVDVTSLPDLGPLPDTSTAFLVHRYDRTGGERIHQEDFAQVLGQPPDRKYQATDAAGLLHVVAQVLGRDGAEEGLRRLVVIVATGNCDAHLKNWSLIYPDRVTARWSPLYDQVATIAYGHLDKRPALRIGTAHHLHQLDRGHLRWVGGRAGIEEGRVDAVVDETLSRLRQAFTRGPMDAELSEALVEHWKRVPLLRDYTLA